MKKQNEKKQPTVKFENAKTYGDNINALFEHFADNVAGKFVLEQALDKLKTYNATKEKLLNEMVKEK